ncbi:MAG: DUF488 domain-containing protein [Herbaspirillum sp.]
MTGKSRVSTPLVCTIGHSTRSLEEFVNLLQANQVTHVIDVRTVPRSRHNPQYNRDALPVSLQPFNISYTYLQALGGLRHVRAGSINLGWRNLSFRGYADYMQSAEFAAGMEELMPLVQQQRCTLMCAEAVPWRCHRSMIGDALLVRGAAVEDIISASPRKPHRLTPWAQVDGLEITYPAPALGQTEASGD